MCAHNTIPLWVIFYHLSRNKEKKKYKNRWKMFPNNSIFNQGNTVFISLIFIDKSRAICNTIKNHIARLSNDMIKLLNSKYDLQKATNYLKFHAVYQIANNWIPKKKCIHVPFLSNILLNNGEKLEHRRLFVRSRCNIQLIKATSTGRLNK